MKSTHFHFTAVMVAGMATVGLQGCAGLSGLDSEGKFACKAPDGVTCMSVSGIYANSKANNLPGLRKHGEEEGAEATQTGGSEAPTSGSRRGSYEYNAPANNLAVASGSGPASPKTMMAPHSGSPMRTPERVLRVWMAPYTDSEGDLHDQNYFYVTVAAGQWLIEANRSNIRREFQSITPLQRTVSRPRTDAPSPDQQAQALMQSQQTPPAQDLPVSPVDPNPGAGIPRE